MRVSSPPSQATSQWTLDYPPFFAWFEWLLSQPAALVDPVIVSVDAMDYASPPCVLYQRFTVILSDLTLLYALYQLATPTPPPLINTTLCTTGTTDTNHGDLVLKTVSWQPDGQW